MNNEARRVEQYFKVLVRTKPISFPAKGYTESLGVPATQGVYIIYDNEKKVAHVGRTTRGKRGLRQRLNNHLLGQSSFAEHSLLGHGSWLRTKGYVFKYIEIKNDRERALLEAYAIGKLCPSHLGLSSKTEAINT